ncbi:MAG: sigma-70 family RNA polymerase sigma factor [Kiritimatiellae bacterium]|nr:sigma-70 family RNA polymerase sigma factor [Kiritimatiellia bacterium]
MHDEKPASDGIVPDTSTTLLRELAGGADAARWAKFVELYTPVLRAWLGFLRGNSFPALAEDMFDDIVQETFVSLVKVFPNGGYHRDRARFRTFLQTILRKRAVDALRRSDRQRLRFLPAGRMQEIADATPLPDPSPDGPDGRALHARLWHLLVEHVFRESRFSERSKAVFLRLAAGESPAALAREFGLEENAIYQLKARVMKKLAAKARALARESGDILDLVCALEQQAEEQGEDPDD